MKYKLICQELNIRHFAGVIELAGTVDLFLTFIGFIVGDSRRDIQIV